MIVKILASGSKGNSTYIECGEKKILIDAGICFQRIKKELDSINVNVKDLDIVFITHVHSDHIKGLSTLLSKTEASLYVVSTIYDDLIKKMDIPKFHIIDNSFNIGDIEIELLPLSHDVECYSYIIKYMRTTLVYITDTGYLNKKYFSKISNKEIYIIEANHDENMLMNGPYPHILKQRILSDKGHLSNSVTGKILSNIIGSKTKYIYLAHISEQNNTKKLALKQVKEQLVESDFDLKKIIVTDQDISSDMIEV